MALRWLWVALPRLSRLDVGCSTFDVRKPTLKLLPGRSSRVALAGSYPSENSEAPKTGPKRPKLRF